MNTKSVVRRVIPRFRNSSWLEAQCEKCRQIFRVQPSLATGEKRQRFCSNSCSVAARNAKN